MAVTLRSVIKQNVQEIGAYQSEIFSVTGNWTVPEGARIIYISACGGGGGGAYNNTANAGGGGGQGGAACIRWPVWIDSDVEAATIAVTIGAKGVKGATGGHNAGTNGTDTKFGTDYVVCEGGQGAPAGEAAAHGVFTSKGGGLTTTANFTCSNVVSSGQILLGGLGGGSYLIWAEDFTDITIANTADTFTTAAGDFDHDTPDFHYTSGDFALAVVDDPTSVNNTSWDDVRNITNMTATVLTAAGLADVDETPASCRLYSFTADPAIGNGQFKNAEAAGYSLPADFGMSQFIHLNGEAGGGGGGGSGSFNLHEFDVNPIAFGDGSDGGNASEASFIGGVTAFISSTLNGFGGLGGGSAEVLRTLNFGVELFGATDLLTRTSGSWITDGWLVGDTFELSGSGSNNYVFKVISVTALDLGVTAGTLQASEASQTDLVAWVKNMSGGGGGSWDAGSDANSGTNATKGGGGCGGQLTLGSGASDGGPGYMLVEWFE